MYEVREFKPALYVLILLGISGYALAAQAPILWTLATATVLANAWLVRTGRFVPWPRWIVNLITLAAFCLMAMQIAQLGQRSALVIGQFLVILQLIKLFEQRSNRDYGQAIVLGLLLMVAAAINTASLVFGLVLLAYLLVGLYTSLLFDLKEEADRVRAATTVIEPPAPADARRRHQQSLSRSLRRLTGVISGVGGAMAIAVFVLFPRWGTGGMIPQIELRSTQTLTGFSDRVGFQQVARIQQNEQVVAHVRVHHNGQLVEGTEPLLLRGVTLDAYTGNSQGPGGRWQWMRSPVQEQAKDARRGAWLTLAEPGADEWRQEVRLLPTGTHALFALPGAVRIQMTRRDTSLVYTPTDEALRLQDRIVAPVEYEVVSRGTLSLPPSGRDEGRMSLRRLQRLLPQVARRPPLANIDPRIGQYARRPEVSGSNAQGPLHEQRPISVPTHELDEAIATNIERHLTEQFTYTLDLTDTQRVESQDPIVGFLYDFRRGHCEYFAGAMTIMCQDLGLTARMVVGFLCDEYNTFTDSYVVRQSHAHAWVEVLLPDGSWRSFDPTSSREAGGGTRQQLGALAQLAGRFRHLLDYLEESWATNVVAYDGATRDALIDEMNQQITESAVESSQSLFDMRQYVEGLGSFLASHVIGPIAIVLVTGGVGAIVWHLVRQWRLRRKALRIGLQSLPPREQKRLARQLGFYDELLQVLERRRITRAAHLTPLEFSRSLSFLPLEAADAIHRLTRIFYRVRYGQAELSPWVHSRLRRVVLGLEQSIPRPQGQ
jgi:transglutaminase-like putative cysteine protease